MPHRQPATAAHGSADEARARSRQRSSCRPHSPAPRPARGAAGRDRHPRAGRCAARPGVTRAVVEAFVRSSLERPRLSRALDELTAREREVLELLARGRSNAEIAEAIVISEATVKTHVGHVLLGARDRVQAVIFAYESGVVRPGLPKPTRSRPHSVEVGSRDRAQLLVSGYEARLAAPGRHNRPVARTTVCARAGSTRLRCAGAERVVPGAARMPDAGRQASCRSQGRPAPASPGGRSLTLARAMGPCRSRGTGRSRGRCTPRRDRRQRTCPSAGRPRSRSRPGR
jgi:DNA-binding CsgD family transcriptional regulator